MSCIGHGTSLKTSFAPSSAGGELLRAMQSSPLPSSPPFMSGVCSSTFQSTLPRHRGKARLAGASRNRSVQGLRKQAQRLRTRAQELRTRAQELRTRAQELRTRAQELRTRAQELRTRAQRLRTRAQQFRTRAARVRKARRLFDTAREWLGTARMPFVKTSRIKTAEKEKLWQG